MTPDEKRQLNELIAFKRSLEHYDSIPFQVDRAFRRRLITAEQLAVSTKGASTEDITTSDTGGEVVLGDPDGFLEIEIKGVIYYLPYFT